MYWGNTGSQVAGSSHSFGQAANKCETAWKRLAEGARGRGCLLQADSPCLACEAGSRRSLHREETPGIPQSVGHIMTFYCVVRRKSAYYACATAFAATSAALLLIVGCLERESEGEGIADPGQEELLQLLLLLLVVFVLAIVLQINIILWYRVCFANCCMCGADSISGRQPGRRRADRQINS